MNHITILHFLRINYNYLILFIMKLFLSQQACLNSANAHDHFCKVLDVFANYIRAPQSKTGDIVITSESDMAQLGIKEVSSVLYQ